MGKDAVKMYELCTSTQAKSSHGLLYNWSNTTGVNTTGPPPRIGENLSQLRPPYHRGASPLLLQHFTGGRDFWYQKGITKLGDHEF